MILEDLCEKEDDLEMKQVEYNMQFTKAGDDMERPAITEYLKKERLI